MKPVLGFCSLILAAITLWYFGDRLSNETIGVLIGLVFGLMTAVPTTGLILCLYSDRMETSGAKGPPIVTVNQLFLASNTTSNAARQIEQKSYRVIEET